MKFLIGFFLAVFMFVACNQDATPDEPDAYRQTPVQNVNGNIPDTTNAINLETQKEDHTRTVDTTQ